MQFLKQSTAFTAIVGPVLDSDGVEYTGAVIGDLSISKNGTEAAMAAAATLTHVSNGYYTLVGTTGNSDTLGRVTIRCNKSTYQMPVMHYEVLASTAFDVLVTNGTIASTTNITAGTITTVDTLTTYTGNTVQTGDAYAALTSAVADSVPADGSRPSVQQALYMIIQYLTEKSISGTTVTVKKPDGSSSLFTCTLNSSTTPTSSTRNS